MVWYRLRYGGFGRILGWTGVLDGIGGSSSLVMGRWIGLDGSALRRRWRRKEKDM